MKSNQTRPDKSESQISNLKSQRSNPRWEARLSVVNCRSSSSALNGSATDKRFRSWRTWPSAFRLRSEHLAESIGRLRQASVLLIDNSIHLPSRSLLGYGLSGPSRACEPDKTPAWKTGALLALGAPDTRDLIPRYPRPFGRVAKRRHESIRFEHVKRKKHSVPYRF